MRLPLYRKLWAIKKLQQCDTELCKKVKEKIYRYLKRHHVNVNDAFTTGFFNLRYSGHLDNMIDRHVYRYGAFEKHILFFMRDILSQFKQPTLIDIGCNVGQHSLFASQYAANVHAFDPFPQVLNQFKKNIQLNHIENIHLHAVGLGIENSLQQFYVPPAVNKGMGSFLDDFSDENHPGPMLPIVQGDEYFNKHGIPSFELMKVDVEGFEKNVLLGLKQTLTKVRPVIIVEVTKHTNSGLSTLIDFSELFPMDYTFYLIIKKVSRKKNADYVLSRLEWDSLPNQADIVAIPNRVQACIVDQNILQNTANFSIQLPTP